MKHLHLSPLWFWAVSHSFQRVSYTSVTKCIAKSYCFDAVVNRISLSYFLIYKNTRDFSVDLGYWNPRSFFLMKLNEDIEWRLKGCEEFPHLDNWKFTCNPSFLEILHLFDHLFKSTHLKSFMSVSNSELFETETEQPIRSEHKSVREAGRLMWKVQFRRWLCFKSGTRDLRHLRRDGFSAIRHSLLITINL